MFKLWMRLMDAANDDKTTGGDTAGQIQTLQQRLDAANGSAAVVAQQLYNELFSLRADFGRKVTEIERLTQENADLKAKLPAEGVVILTGDEVKKWNVVKAVTLSPEEIKGRLESTADEELTRLRRKDLIREAADAPSFDETVRFKSAVLGQVIGDSEMQMRDVTKDNKTRKVAHVKVTTDAGEQWMPLAEYAEKHKADFLPSLRIAGDSRRHVKQDAGGSGSAGTVFDRIREEEKAKQAAANANTIPLEKRLGLAQAT